MQLSVLFRRDVMSDPRQDVYAVVANGFADGPAQALRDHLVARGASVVAVSHPLSLEEGARHVVARYVSGKLVQERATRLPLRPPLSFALDPAVPLRLPRVDTWFGFNPLACARGLVDRKVGRAGEVVLWSVDFVPDRFGRGTHAHPALRPTRPSVLPARRCARRALGRRP